VTLRPATVADALALWRWRSDPQTRRASFDEADITLDHHRRWLDESLARPDRRIDIVLVDGADAGMVRLDLEGDRAVVSINVAPEWRGRGVGPAALRAVARRALDELEPAVLVAKIKRENLASRRAFARAGFRVVEAGEWLVLERRARPRVVAAIQARMGSTRLPGKVLQPIAGRPMIAWLAQRLARCREVDQVVVSTSVESRDDAIAEFARGAAVACVRGSESDLVQRLRLTARQCDADVIVRVTADCPFVEPAVVDDLVRALRPRLGELDFVTNNDPPTFPHGLDAEVMPTATLDLLDLEVQDPYDREWIPVHIKGHRDRFRILNVAHDADLSAHRWTVDYPEDLEFASAVFTALRADFSMHDVLRLLAARPALQAINAMHAHGRAVARGAGSPA
jgi:spore coat polysaccharide biosynthesis protein SpsF (cytidylyltransferase family)/RimJ/RimL family protein N-acetyltransferase